MTRASDTFVIATHRRPDGDALVSTWLADRFLSNGATVGILFVARDFDVSNSRKMKGIHCVVDIGNAHDPSRLLFDHKPPAFPDRHLNCAATLVWKYLIEQEYPVEHLAELMQTVHDGDSIKRRGGSALYKQSRESGLHAKIHRHQQESLPDESLYRRIRDWLDRRYLPRAS